MPDHRRTREDSLPRTPETATSKVGPAFQRLLGLMADLRDPARGCPWTRAQTFETIVPYTIEEVYEVVDAIRAGDMEALCDELGDLLLQVIYHARMAEEAGAFAMAEVIEALSDKLVRRHPHVFAEEAAADSEAVVRNWGAHQGCGDRAEPRRRERAGRGAAVRPGAGTGAEITGCLGPGGSRHCGPRGRARSRDVPAAGAAAFGSTGRRRRPAVRSGMPCLRWCGCRE